MGSLGAREELRRIVRETPLPSDRELFPELIDGTAKGNLGSVIEELICEATEYDSLPSSVKETTNGSLQEKVLKYIAEKVDEKLDEDLLQYGAKTDIPEVKYAAFCLKKSNRSEGRNGTRTDYTYCGRRNGLLLLDGDDDIVELDLVKNVFGKHAKSQMDILEKVNESLYAEAPNYWMLFVPAVMGILYKLICVVFPSWPNFQKMAGVAGIAISGIALFFFFILHDWNNQNSMYRRYKRGEFPVEQMVLGIHRSLRYRRILVKRMGLKCPELERQEKRFEEMRKWD